MSRRHGGGQPEAGDRRGSLPAWLVLTLVGLGGVGSAVQSAVNGELGTRVGTAVVSAVVNNVGGTLVLLVGLLVLPSFRAGLATLRRTRLPWWAYLGGLCGAVFVLAAAYVVPILGVAVFTIAQVAGNGTGGLAVDRLGLGPAGRLALSGPRIAGALLGITAVALAQLGRPIGDLPLPVVLFAVLGGLVVAVQAALNGRVSAVNGASTATIINFILGTAVLLALAAATGVFTRLGTVHWPTDWYLYAGGLMGVGVVLVMQAGVRAVGVLRTGLTLVAGQLAGALLLDTLRPGGPGARPAVLVGALLTVLAVVVSGRTPRRWQTVGMTEAEVVRLRPRRIRVMCWFLAPALVLFFSVVATALRGPTGDTGAVFQRGDQLAMIGLGLVSAFVILMFTRPMVEADERGVRVRNVIGSYDLPWDVVRSVRFDRGSAWASLELHNDDLVPILALQTVDKELAVAGVRALRTRHAVAQRAAPRARHR